MLSGGAGVVARRSRLLRRVRLPVEARDLEQQGLDLAVELVVAELGAGVAEAEDVELELVAAAAEVLGEGALGLAGEEVDLVGAAAVDGGAPLGRRRGVQPLVERRGRPQAVAVVVDEG